MPLNDKPSWLSSDGADAVESLVDHLVAAYFVSNPAAVVKVRADDKLHEFFDQVANASIDRVYEVIEATCVTNENRILTNA